LGITKIEQIIDSPENEEWAKQKGVFLQILTGRTHQIRYHLSHHGLPIVGDYLYGKECDIPMQLTAYKMLYQDIDGTLQSVEIA
jgi:23S rRNA-/tRNA-specific pseudouridylate synthase